MGCFLTLSATGKKMGYYGNLPDAVQQIDGERPRKWLKAESGRLRGGCTKLSGA